MSEKLQPVSKDQVPDPAHSYERSDPKRESGAGRLTNNANATPTQGEDKMASAVHHAQDGSKQLNVQKSATTDPNAGTTEENQESLGWEKKQKA